MPLFIVSQIIYYASNIKSNKPFCIALVHVLAILRNILHVRPYEYGWLAHYKFSTFFHVRRCNVESNMNMKRLNFMRKRCQ